MANPFNIPEYGGEFLNTATTDTGDGLDGTGKELGPNLRDKWRSTTDVRKCIYMYIKREKKINSNKIKSNQNNKEEISKSKKIQEASK
mgnify:CR=1 FL=1